MVLPNQVRFCVNHIWFLWKEVDNMTVSELIKDMAKRKEEMGLTSRMISDASNVPKSTVDRILRGETRDPSAQTILDMAYVVGYRLINDNDTKEESSDSKLVAVLERESRLKTVQHNTIVAEKDRTIADKSRWLKFTAVIAVSFAVLLVVTWIGIALVLHYDLTHATEGYFRW